jgi:type IV pilus assembly protein PilC
MERVHFIAQSRFARDLAGLLRLGYPSLEAVEKLKELQPDDMRDALGRSVIKMRAGSSLADSLKDESAFLPLFVRLLATSEASESLPEGSERAATLLEDLSSRKTRCFLAALYPTLVLTIVALIFWALCVAGGDVLSDLLTSLNLTLPPSTRLLMTVSEIGKSPLGLLLFFGSLVLLWLIVLGYGNLSHYLYKFPFIGPWLIRQESVIYLNTLGQLTENGVSLADAAKLALTSCSAPAQAKLLEVPEKLLKGDTLSQALTSTAMIPELAVWAIERREETESLELLEIADMLDRELSLTLDRGLVAFEPLTMLAVAIFLVFFSGAVFLPINQLIGNLG